MNIITEIDATFGNLFEREVGPMVEFANIAEYTAHSSDPVFKAMRTLNLYMNGTTWTPDDSDDDVAQRFTDVHMYVEGVTDLSVEGYTDPMNPPTWIDYICDSRDAA